MGTWISHNLIFHMMAAMANIPIVFIGNLEWVGPCRTYLVSNYPHRAALKLAPEFRQ